jgi:glycosyltransferase involved in cell wall biosynthesis
MWIQVIRDRVRSFLGQEAAKIWSLIIKLALGIMWRKSLFVGSVGDHRPEFGANLAGFFTGRFGTAASSRAFAQALALAQVPHVLDNVVSRTHGERHPSAHPFTSANPYAINLIHVNPDTAAEFIFSRTSLIDGLRHFRGKYNIGIWYWENSRFPARWISLFRFYDEIWATSSFVFQSLSTVSPVPVVKMRYPLLVDTRVIDHTARRRLGLQEDQCVFLFVFDFASVVERKNPLALIRAFGQAFSRNDKAALVLSHINSTLNPSCARRLEEASANLNVKIVSKHLSEEEYVSILAASDCYVSLHRSEGLGLPMAEAMYLGKPVIATAYGGNVDFMNASNSLPLNYELVELDKDYGPYEKGSLWAEPDVGQAVELMTWVCENRELAKRIGQRAAEDIREFMNPMIASQEIRARLELVYSDNFCQTS